MSSNTNSILVVNIEGHVKTFTLSHTTLRLLAASFGMFMIVFTLMTWGFLHFRAQSQAINTESITQLEQQKAQLVSQIGSLTGTIQRIEKFTQKLESSIGVESGHLRTGVGPLSEQEDLGDFLNRVQHLPKLSAQSMSQDWRAGKFDEGFYDKLSLKLGDLTAVANNLEARVNEVYEANEDKLSFTASSPSLWPVQGWVTSAFGYRFSPWGEGVRMHKGIDIAAPYGSLVEAPSDGVVIFAGYKGGYGQSVIIDHGYGVSTLYGHASQLFVTEGAQIKRGMKIASVGSTGASTGPHLHYEVHVDGIPTDPMKHILQ